MLTSNLIHIIVNLYSFPFVIKEYVCEQLAPITIMEGRGKHEGTFKDSGKNSKKPRSRKGTEDPLSGGICITDASIVMILGQ